MDARDLEGLSRSDLIAKAESLGIDEADLLTRAELSDEILRRTVDDPIERRIARGLLGVARDLVARVVERGLHLPEAAALIRGTQRPSWVPPKPPIATVTLAGIYAAQGHKSRALSVLDEVLETESDHAAAREMRDAIAAAPGDEPAIGPEPEETSAEPALEAEPAEGVTLPVDEEVPPAAWEEPAAPDVPPSVVPPSVEVANDVASLPSADAVAIAPLDPNTVCVSWQLRQRSFDARAIGDGANLIVRIVAVIASWEAPVVEIRDIDVRKRVGDWLVRDLPAGAELRAAIGWLALGEFAPLAVAMDVTPDVAESGEPAGESRRGERSSSSWPSMQRAHAPSAPVLDSPTL